MKKNKLPPGWVVVNSKSHPERVYYFNVKTKQSSWNEPSSDPIVQAQSSKKRKICDKDESFQLNVTTKEQEVVQDEGMTNRKKLHAKRNLQTSKEKGSSKTHVQPKTVKETPQMKEIRQKILQKKSKDAGIKKAASKNASPNDNLQSSVDAIQTSGLPKPANNKKSMGVVKDKLDIKKQVLTPQMRVIYERMQQKGGKNVALQKQPQNSTDNKQKLPLTRSRGRSNIRPQESEREYSDSQHGSAETSSTISLSTYKHKSTRNNTCPSIEDDIPTTSLKKRETATIATRKQNVKEKLKRGASCYISIQDNLNICGKQNLAKDRMQKLRNHLSNENDTLEAGTSSNRPCLSPSERLTRVGDNIDIHEPPTVYKNAEVRLKRLRLRLSKVDAPSNIKVSGNESADVRSSTEEHTTVDKLIKNYSQNQCYEEMDWEPLPDEKIMYEVQAVRTQLGGDNLHRIPECLPENVLTAPLLSEPKESNKLYIVIDTNVLLSNVQAVEEARDTVFKTYGRPTIVIPWTVIRELDYIKGSTTKSKALQMNARRAVRFLHQHFIAKHPRVVGQTLDDAVRNKEKFAADCPDDEILQTCLQIRDLGKSVALLSYDKNLCNKAMIYDMMTIGRNDPLEKIDYLNACDAKNDSFHNLLIQDASAIEHLSPLNTELRVSEEILEDAKAVIKNLLTVIVSNEMQSLYGEKWEKYTIISPPWTVVDVLKCAIKHWIAATSESFHHRADTILKELAQVFRTMPEGGWRLANISHILEQCGKLIQMVVVQKYPDIMEQAFNEINELKRKCFEWENRIAQKKLVDEIGVEVDPNKIEVGANKAFKYFEVIYDYARDMCGMAADAVGMPCSIFFKVRNPIPSAEYIRQIQPEVAANVNRLLHNLSTALEEIETSCINSRSLHNLYHTLVTFAPGVSASCCEDVTPLDVYYCLTNKKEVLKAGISQLQEISTHFCRLASYRCA